MLISVTYQTGWIIECFVTVITVQDSMFLLVVDCQKMSTVKHFHTQLAPIRPVSFSLFRVYNCVANVPLDFPFLPFALDIILNLRMEVKKDFQFE